MEVIIFSYNRYPQLELLLNSLEKNSSEPLNISVLYQEREDILPVKKTQEKIAKKFERSDKISSIKTIASEDFKVDLMKLLDESGETVLFCNDSNIVYKMVQFGLINSSLEDHEDALCFSLRLGKNVTRCYNMQADNNMYGIEDAGDYLIKWPWNKAYLDFGYPFSFDGHIFRSKEIKKLIKNSRGTTPIELEDSLQMFDTYPKGHMLAFKESVLVNRADVLQGDGNMQELIVKYASGKKIVYTTSYFNDVNAVTKEINLKFK